MARQKPRGDQRGGFYRREQRRLIPGAGEFRDNGEGTPTNSGPPMNMRNAVAYYRVSTARQMVGVDWDAGKAVTRTSL